MPFLQDYIPYLIIFKGAVSRDFKNFFFHESNPSGPLINSLKWFFLKIRPTPHSVSLRGVRLHKVFVNFGF